MSERGDTGVDDPARFASARPEPEFEGEAVTLVGVGPGNIEFLTPRGERHLREADVVVGFETVVSLVEPVLESETAVLTCGYRDETETLERFAERVEAGEHGVAVAMGDPNHSGYQFVGKVEAALAAAGVGRPVRIVPGISSLQVAASRARTPMEETTFVTLHKRGPIDGDLERLARDAGERHLLVLPRPFDWMPESIAAFLRERGTDPDLEALVLERLTHEDEAVHRFSLEELAGLEREGTSREDTPFSDLSVLAVRTTEASDEPRSGGER
ncbi:cobalt-precorrin-7 (C(5))-methyltransferase [Natronobiforma cellulositropha]|uniref:cobalt-precorrin-7 (C(5))-methyltransferase n=1 Tax=Natronobiforma cellulositropha TaxID=1679076 RepID=UPI0021D5E20B|nr:cobalt-precorrin-7 (C(5))-methyltransferase [Natronobiforma cellulositropha]